MSRVVSLEDFVPGERFDGNPWTQARIEESANADGPWSALETQALSPLDPNPADPQPRSFTTALAQLAAGYYRVVFIDVAANEDAVGPVYSPSGTQAYTSVLDVRRVLSPDGDPSAALGTAASLSDDALEEAIEEAATEINGRLAVRYSLPFAAPIPPLVETLNRDIAAYLATLTHRRGVPVPDGDPVALRYARAQALLGQAAKGTIELVEVVDGSEPQSAEAAVVNLYEGDLFSPEQFFRPEGIGVPWAPGREY